MMHGMLHVVFCPIIMREEFFSNARWVLCILLQARDDILSKMKIANLMELPPAVLTDNLFIKGNEAIPYPAPLLELWRKSTQPLHDSPSSKSSLLKCPWDISCWENLGKEIRIILCLQRRAHHLNPKIHHHHYHHRNAQYHHHHQCHHKREYNLKYQQDL